MSGDGVQTRPPFSFLTSLLLPEVLLIFALALDLPRFSRITLFLLFALLYNHALHSTTGDKMQDYNMGSTIGGQFFTALNLLLFVEPLKQYRHSTDIGDDDRRDRPLMQRVYWAGCLVISPRAFGWKHQVAYLPASPNMKRIPFIISRILRILVSFLIIDAGQTFIHTRPMFSVSAEQLQWASITSHGLLFRCAIILAWMSQAFFGIRMYYDLASVASVALGISTPANWPEPFGNWKESYTLRKFWGRTWHQMLRHNLTSFGKATTKLFGFKKGTLLSSYTQLFVAFTISGVLHCFGDAMVGRKYFGSSLEFFFLQAVAISVEDAVIGVANRSGLLRRGTTYWTRAIGYAWVVAWFVASVPGYIDWAVRAGIGSCEALPVSPIRSVLAML